MNTFFYRFLSIPNPDLLYFTFLLNNVCIFLDSKSKKRQKSGKKEAPSMGQKSVNIHLSSVGENRSKAAPRRWERSGENLSKNRAKNSPTARGKFGQRSSRGKRQNRAKIPLRQGKKSSENSPPRRGKIGKKADKKPSQKPV